MKTLRAFVSDLPLTLSLLVAVVILWGTLSPPSGGGGALPLTDKQIHAIAFALLIIPLACTDLRRALRYVPVAIGFGAAIELVQPWVGRTGDWADLGANALGILIGLAIGVAVRRRKRV